jgi:mRNA guanylyltransferase
MDLGYGIQAVLKDRIPRLEHGNDGLIFTCITSGYTCGTDSKM